MLRSTDVLGRLFEVTISAPPGIVVNRVHAKVWCRDAEEIPLPRVFSEKRLQAIENKRNECRKERKETTKRRQEYEKA